MLSRMWGWVVLIVAAAYAVYRLALGYPRPIERYQSLMRGEAEFLANAADALFPPGGAIHYSGVEADLPGYTDRLVAASHPRIRLAMHGLFFLVEHATLFFPAPGGGGRRRFSSLGRVQQVGALEGWEHSRFYLRRVVFTSLRSILTLAYFAHPPVLRQLRLAPLAIDTPICEADLLYPPIGGKPEAIRYQRADLTPIPDPGIPLDLDGPIHPPYADNA
jgi:hypothetical protein